MIWSGPKKPGEQANDLRFLGNLRRACAGYDLFSRDGLEESQVRTAKVSRVINGWKVNFYAYDKKQCSWYTPVMEEADEVEP